MASAKNYEKSLEKINQLAESLRRRKSDLVDAAAQDAGFPAKITSLELDLAIKHLQTMEEEISQIEGKTPYGTIAAIFPYDAPGIFLARIGGAVLLTGSRLRFSFSSQTPRTAKILDEITRPFDAFKCRLGQDNREFGLRCVDDPLVRVLFISGSSAVGKAYRQHHQAFDKLFFAGPGGMPAAVVFEDADPAAAASFIARRAFINGGQYCTTLKKVMIHKSLYETVRELVLDKVRQLKVGDPLDPETDIGPIRVERTRRILHNAVEKCPGALRINGKMDGEWIDPLIFEMEQIPDLELFGPFLALKPFTDPHAIGQEVIQTRYGFLLAFFGSPPESVRTSFYEHFGMVYDNPDFVFTPLRLPFGGKKESGWILERRGEQWTERDGAFRYSEELVRNGSN